MTRRTTEEWPRLGSQQEDSLAWWKTVSHLGCWGREGIQCPAREGAALPRPWLYSREGSCRWVLVEGWVRCCCAVGRAPEAGRPELLSRAACRTPRHTDKAQAAAGQERARIRRWCQVIARFRVTHTAWCHTCPPLTLLHSSQVRGQALAGSRGKISLLTKCFALCRTGS